jgi:hypothetical protein
LWGEGAEGCFLWSPEDLLELHFNDHKLKMTFLFKTSEIKKFLKIFCEKCFIKKKTCLAYGIPDLFSFKIKGRFKGIVSRKFALLLLVLLDS